MSEWTPHVLTAAGRRLQAKVEAGMTLALTRMKLGSGQETLDEVDELLDLVAVESEFPISSAQVSGEVCTVRGVFSTTSISHGFYCREWGIYAEDPDEGEILYAVLIDEKPDWIPANAPTELTVTYCLNIAVANGTTIMAVIDPAGLVDVDMLNEYTHTGTREARYVMGDILNMPTLPHGLVLECQSDGKTDVVLPDVSRMSCGDTFLDGSVLWQVKRPILAPSDAYYYKAEWMYAAFQRIIEYLREVSRKTPPTLPIAISSEMQRYDTAWICSDIGMAQNVKAQIVLDDKTIDNPACMVMAENRDIYYVGGDGVGMSIDDILVEGENFAGTVFLHYSKTKPLAAGYAWLESDIEGEIVNARPTIVLDDGSRITATKGKIVRSDDVFYYLDAVSREPLITSGAISYAIATEDDIDAIIDRLGGGQNG